MMTSLTITFSCFRRIQGAANVLIIEYVHARKWSLIWQRDDIRLYNLVYTWTHGGYNTSALHVFDLNMKPSNNSSPNFARCQPTNAI